MSCNELHSELQAICLLLSDGQISLSDFPNGTNKHFFHSEFLMLIWQCRTSGRETVNSNFEVIGREFPRPHVQLSWTFGQRFSVPLSADDQFFDAMIKKVIMASKN